MIRHASSHGFSVLVTTIVAALLIDIFRNQLGNFIVFVDDNVSTHFVSVLNLPFDKQTFTIILVAAFLAAIWGVFFKIAKK